MKLSKILRKRRHIEYYRGTMAELNQDIVKHVLEGNLKLAQKRAKRLKVYQRRLKLIKI